jgi:tetratricopeptide (TPR) repeat protein
MALQMATSAEDSISLAESIAYDYINQGNYQDAIPYLNQYAAATPEDAATLYNLTICLNNVGMYDSAKVVYERILEVDPQNADALSGVGRYFNELGRRAADSARAAEAAGDEAAKKKWLEKRQTYFDSSRVYLKRAYELNPDDKFVTETYALAAALSQNWENAAEAFRHLTEIEPNNADHWVSLGDCLINMKDWQASVVAYEKVVELEPDNKQIWEQLADLYQQLGMKDKEAEARSHLQ